MQSFPMFIKTTGRTVVVVGDGEQAAQKCRLLLKSDADILLLGDHPDDELLAMIKQGRIRQQAGQISRASFETATIGFIATGSPAADVCIHAIAKDAGLLVNVVDRPELCDLTTPSIVDRDPVVVAIGTEGNAPVLGRRIKTQIEQMLDPSVGRFAEAVGRLRGMVARYVPQSQRRAFWREVFVGQIWQTFKRGSERDAIQRLKAQIMGEHPASQVAQVTLIDSMSGQADMISLRGVERLQEADEIFYEQESDQAILELARRDAERNLLGSVTSDHTWPIRSRISFIRQAAKPGRNIVWISNCDNSETTSNLGAFTTDPAINFEVISTVPRVFETKAAIRDPSVVG